jgi:hypothetical protein
MGMMCGPKVVPFKAPKRPVVFLGVCGTTDEAAEKGRIARGIVK